MINPNFSERGSTEKSLGDSLIPPSVRGHASCKNETAGSVLNQVLH
jgi:hypothetical protein